MERFALPLLALAAALALPGTADARDRHFVPLDRSLAGDRVLQLSPSAGVAVEYRGGVPRSYGQVVFEGNIPVGVVGPDGLVHPMGGLTPRPPTVVIVAPHPSAHPRPVIRHHVAPHPHAVVPVHPVAAPAQRAVAVHPAHTLDPVWLPQTVHYPTAHATGTIVIDTNAKFLYLVGQNGQAMRYGVGVGKEGFSWRGTERVTRKAEWPGWTPPREMIARERAKGVILPAHMPGGPENPLGARALYLGSTLYRIHGTNQPWTIGQAVSSGCIRMRNEDVVDLYGRVPVGAKVVVI